MGAMVNRLVRDEAGQDLIEYALLAAFIAVGSILAISAIGPLVKKVFETVGSDLGKAVT